ncbi:MAG TPA: hypothetical protein VEZ11_03670 [Thermoanaerobaculia bacterium]|nr:hypothetical protein [Thermoanaerobaculia bacterium]
MVTILFFGLLLVSMSVALADWRKGWYMAVLCGVLQDPARKMTPGTPVAMSMTIVLVYAVILFAAQKQLQESARILTQRFSRVYAAGVLLFFFLVLAAVNGLFTYGVEFWKVPALSLFTYLAPVPAVVIGFTFMQSEKHLFDFFLFYAVVTSIMLIGGPLELMHVNWSAIGMVALPEGYIRYLPGLQIRILSGFYRAPDIMGWHAATLTIIGITMALRKNLAGALPWIGFAAWGFFNCLISGRRKAFYTVAVFGLVFLWRYLRRLTITQFVSFVLVGAALTMVVQKVSSNEESSVYAKGAATSRQEVFERLEGGVIETISQFGLMGAGLGTATQGVRHLLGHDENVGWQEGGLGKLAVELGLPGLIAAAIFVFVLVRFLLLITSFVDEPHSTQLVRVALFGIFAANVVEFMVSAQAYSDATLTLITAFFLGCLLATPTLADRAAAPETEPAPRPALRPATV